jgi:rubrerythrin
MPDPDKTIERLIEAAIAIECQAAGIYQTFSEQFTQVPGLSAFWQSLNKDEIEHAAILKDTRSLLTPEQLSTQPGDKMWEDITVIRRMMDQDPAAAVRTLDDAYELAHELESSETNAIFRFLAAECVPSGIRKELIHSVLERHLNKLTDFSQTFGDREWRRGIKKTS